MPVEWSRRNLLEDAGRYRLNSAKGESWFPNHLKIDNTELEPEEVAERIAASFGLTPVEKEEKEYRYGA